MLVLAPVISLMPRSTLAAVVIIYSAGLIQPAEFRAILAVRRNEFIWSLAALAGVVTLGTLQGILVAIIVSVVGLAQQVSNPPVYLLGRKRGTNALRPLSPSTGRTKPMPASPRPPARVRSAPGDSRILPVTSGSSIQAITRT